MPLVCTSLAATPAALTAASTRLICSAFWRMAVLPSAAWVTTPAETVAMSGARRASAWDETESRVASAGTVGVACAPATAGADRAMAASRATNGWRIGFSLSGFQGPHGTARQGRVGGMNAP